jgi:Carboxypeptidase regulatory-like domain/TonB dependent receptor-like, beta-barrel/TonB-dependent Receptor Plug Domain
MPGVALQITSASLQGVRTATTGPDGRFRFPAVPPGIYTVTASLPGFHAAEKEATVTLDATVTADFTLEPELQEAVAVTGMTPLVDTTSTTTGTNYSSRVITHLPVSRNYADIVRANPGVLPDTGVTQGRSLALSIYGSTSAENQWIIDGVNTTNVLKGIQGKAVNNEFVQEVEVKTGGYEAEYGRALGGVINVITKSGGNTFHGEGFLYYDSIGTKAERKFEPGVDSEFTGMRTVDYSRADFGLDIGGFIVKDRLWIFAAYDRVNAPSQISPYVSTDLVSDTMRFPFDETDNLYSGKLTWNLAASTTLVGSVFADPTQDAGANIQPVTNPDPGTWQSTRTIGGLDFGLRLNQLVGSSGLLTLQVARHQDQYSLVPTGPGLAIRTEDFTCEGGTHDQACTQPGGPNFVEGGLGRIGGRDNHSSSHRDQIRADGTIYRGDHELKLGADYQDGRTDVLDYFSGGQRVFRYNELGDVYYAHRFFARSVNDLTPIDQPTSGVTRDAGAYVQDSWNPAPNLTLKAGLRFDREWIINYTGTPAFATSLWQPRLGVVWDPLGDGSSKVYASAGRFSYGLPTDLAIWVYGSQVFVQSYNFDPVATAQADVFGHLTADINPTTATAPVDRNLKGIASDELTLGVEKSFEGGTLSVTIKATYRTLSQSIEDRCDLDYTMPENEGSRCALTNPGSSDQFSRGDFHYCTGLDNEFNNCNTGESLFGAPPLPEAKRIYRGIEILARKTVSQRLWLQASYVYSALRGNYDGEVDEGYHGQTDPGISADFDYPQLTHNGYGRLYLDRPHQLRFDGYYQTLIGLSVGIQTWLRSGAPLNKLGYFNAFPYGAAIQLVPKGYSGRLPMEWEANLTVEYPIRFGPVVATLQGYVYNLFNNQIRLSQDTVFTAQAQEGYPDTIYDPNHADTPNENYGRITGRSDPRLFRVALRVSF